jgi:uncharacterized membrane protein
MRERLYLFLRSALYALRGGFLIRPFLIALVFGATGAILSSVEEYAPELGAWIPTTLFPANQDPAVALTILAGIASSIMTVVSIVFAILLMTLTLASTQFSPRILVSFVRDRSTQWTLGIFLGTFSYCMAALPAVRSVPQPFVPTLTLLIAMALALICVGWLIFFINHISRSISVSNIVDRIAREAEEVIDELMPHPRPLHQTSERPEPLREMRERRVVSRKSGYIRYIDVAFLLKSAKSDGVRIIVERRVGHFVAAGVPIMRVAEAGRVTPERETQLLSAIDIGPARTMQQDVEFGVIQIVDIALRAISPAVNDPTTAINCIDQLARVLMRWASRASPQSYLHSPPHVLRLAMPWVGYDEMLDTAFEQIRHYARSDIAVSLRLLRAYDDMVAAGAPPGQGPRLVARAKRVLEGCAQALPAHDVEPLRRRFERLERRVAEQGESVASALPAR